MSGGFRYEEVRIEGFTHNVVGKMMDVWLE